MTMDTSEERDQIPLFGDIPSPSAPAPQPPPRPVPKKKKAGQEPRQPAAVKPPAAVKKNTPKVVSSGLVPEGDVRLTANIREDLHLRLKIAAARRRTTIGEIIEDLVERHVPPA